MTILSNFFHVLMFLDISLSILCAYLIIKLPLNYGIKFVTIPLVLFGTVLMLILGADILGRPFNQYPKGEFEFLEYRVVRVDGKKEIELWVIQDKKSRLHVIPHSDKTEQDLAKAAVRAKKGNKQLGKFDRKGKEENRRLSEDTLTIREIPRENILPPKEDIVPETEPDNKSSVEKFYGT